MTPDEIVAALRRAQISRGPAQSEIAERLGCARSTVALSTADELSGFQLAQASGYNAGSIYPALARLEGTGRILSRWQEGPYPRRRLYRLTDRDVTA